MLYAPEPGAGPVAEGTLALMLAAAKRLGELRDVVRDGAWASRYEVVARDLDGAVPRHRRLGPIGREVARLGARVRDGGARQRPARPSRRRPGAVELVSLAELVARARTS